MSLIISPSSVARITVILRSRFPLAFCSPPRPLKIGIFNDIAGSLYPKQFDGWAFRLTTKGMKLCAALDAWFAQPEYLANCKAGTPRVDLDGKSAGSVSEGEAKWALAELRRRS